MKTNFCILCGNKDNLEHHHIVPRSEGGSNDKTNLITLCVEHHGYIHNIKFKPNAELTSKGLKKRKFEGKVLGRKTKHPTLDSLIEESKKLPMEWLPALVYLSYGYRPSYIAKIKWSMIDELPLGEIHKEYLLKIRPYNFKDEHYVYKITSRNKAPNQNQITVFFNRAYKLLDLVFVDPIISEDELKQASLLLFKEEFEDIDSPYMNKSVQELERLNKPNKVVKIVRVNEDQESYEPTNDYGKVSKIPKNFKYASYTDNLKLTDWIKVNHKIETEYLMTCYLMSLRFGPNDLRELTFLDIYNSKAPEFIKLETKRIQKLLNVKEDSLITSNRHNPYRKPTANALTVRYKRLSEKHFGKQKRGKNSIQFSTLENFD